MAWRSIHFVGILSLIIAWTDIATPANGEDNVFTILFGSEATIQDLHREVIEVKQAVSEIRQSFDEKFNNLLDRFNNMQSELMQQNKEMLQQFETSIATQLKSQRQKSFTELKNSPGDNSHENPDDPNDIDDTQFKYKKYFPQPNEKHVEVNTKTSDQPSSPSCDEAIQLNSNKSGIYTIQIEDNLTKPVYCLPDPNAGSAWHVIQRQGCGKTSFNKQLSEYEQGFGLLNGDFFIGLQTIRKMMIQNGITELWIQLGTSTGESPYELYNKFLISDEKDGYELSNVSVAKGSTEDNLRSSEGHKFEAKSSETIETSCAELQKSGWWYEGGDFCSKGNLNRDLGNLSWGGMDNIIYTHMAIRRNKTPVDANLHKITG